MWPETFVLFGRGLKSGLTSDSTRYTWTILKGPLKE